MTRGTRCAAAVAFGWAVMAFGAARADVIGSPVTGTLTFAGGPTNWFDPAQGAVPSADLNASGTTVTAINGRVEFGYRSGPFFNSADFNGDQLVIVTNIKPPPIGVVDQGIWAMTFTSAAFIGQSVWALSDNFPKVRVEAKIVGDTLTATYAGDAPDPFQAFTATFQIGTTPPPGPGVSVTAVPEPSPLVLGSVAALAVGLLRWRTCRR